MPLIQQMPLMDTPEIFDYGRAIRDHNAVWAELRRIYPDATKRVLQIRETWPKIQDDSVDCEARKNGSASKGDFRWMDIKDRRSHDGTRSDDPDPSKSFSRP